ncbi:hypothetical protein [Nocardia flavorosea]|uniref:Head-to-tail adaptor n=1 Tax=Nocardia flavorosea TaxID=53429 RepID=A0A846YSF0_9NOCA|nr:hypothetical protein [Nocardia flavorosea]NKY60358.1 hypothetical protein [Nocardia flavorosea]
MLVYAAPDDLMDGWLVDVPEEPVALRAIKFASALVRRATSCDHYEVDPAGSPTEPDVIEAMRDATCAHAAMWIEAGINPAAGSAGREIGIQSQSADGGSVTYGDSVSAEEVERSLNFLSPVALGILKSAGLASTRPDTW